MIGINIPKSMLQAHGNKNLQFWHRFYMYTNVANGKDCLFLSTLETILIEVNNSKSSMTECRWTLRNISCKKFFLKWKQTSVCNLCAEKVAHVGKWFSKAKINCIINWIFLGFVTRCHSTNSASVFQNIMCLTMCISRMWSFSLPRKFLSWISIFTVSETSWYSMFEIRSCQRNSIAPYKTDGVWCGIWPDPKPRYRHTKIPIY